LTPDVSDGIKTLRKGLYSFRAIDPYIGRVACGCFTALPFDTDKPDEIVVGTEAAVL